MKGSETTDPGKSPGPKVSRRKWLFENFLSLGLALLLVLAIRSSVIEAYKIPSGSMIPTLLIGDHIFVNKFAYGLKLPFAEWIIDEPIYLIRGEPPERGDIIVFKYPKNEDLYYIKRVVATPGDKIEVREKRVFINDEPVHVEPLSPQEQMELLGDINGENYPLDDFQVFREAWGEERPTVMTDRRGYITGNYGPTVVPEDHLFVMGDNRDHSNDSRFWGFVPMDNVKGRAFIVWLSAWLDFSEGDFTFRPSRIGTILN